MDNYQPTKEELAIINERFAKKPYKSPDQLHAFPAMVIDNRLTAYFTKVHPTFLEQGVRDLNNGVAFMVGHDRDKLPMGRSFKGHLVSDGDAMEVFAKFFMQKNLELNGVNTDAFMRAFLGGTTEDVSIGFAAKRYECSICGKDVREMSCPHWPGKKYNDKNEESETGTLCFAWVMEPAGPKGEALLEVSAVWKGAAPEAKQKKTSDVPKFIIKLTEGKNLKEMPIGEAIAMNFNFPFSGTKGGETVFDINKFFAGEYSKEELPQNIDINIILAQEVSEGEAKTLKDKFKDKGQELHDLLKEFPACELLNDEGVAPRWTRAYINKLPDTAFAIIEPGETKNKNARHLSHHNEKGELDLPRLKNALTRMDQIKPVTDSISAEDLHSKASSHLSQHKLEGNKDKLKILETNNQVLLEQIDSHKAEINGHKQVITKIEQDMQILKDANVQLQQEVKDLKIIAEDGKTYRKDLIVEILGLGVRLQGNNYDVETNKKMLEEPTTKLADIKKIKNQFLQELEERFPRKQTEGKPLHLPIDGEESQMPEEAFKI